MSTTFETIHARRSIRKFTSQPVSREAIMSILDAGRWAPSGLNNQPWRFLILRHPDDRMEKLAGCTKYAHIVHQAQALIVVFLDKAAMYHPMKDYQGAGACIQNMLLAIHELGLGGVWLGEIVNQASDVAQVLNLPMDQWELMAVIALGHPAQKGSSSRKPLKEFLMEELKDD